MELADNSTPAAPRSPARRRAASATPRPMASCTRCSRRVSPSRASSPSRSRTLLPVSDRRRVYAGGVAERFTGVFPPWTAANGPQEPATPRRPATRSARRRSLPGSRSRRPPRPLTVSAARVSWPSVTSRTRFAPATLTLVLPLVTRACRPSECCGVRGNAAEMGHMSACSAHVTPAVGVYDSRPSRILTL